MLWVHEFVYKGPEYVFSILSAFPTFLHSLDDECLPAGLGRGLLSGG